MRNFKKHKTKIRSVATNNMKPVRIDEKTVIFVNYDIPDDCAREKFLRRYADGPKAPQKYF